MVAVLLVEFVHHLHELVLHFLRIGDLLEEEAELCSGRLDLDVSIVEEGGDGSGHAYRYILDVVEAELGDPPVEESVLDAVDDPLIGHHPRIESVHSQGVEDEEPEHHEESRPQEGEDGYEVELYDDRSEYHQYDEGDECSNADEYDPAEESEPVPVKEDHYLFSFFLSLEGICCLGQEAE